VLEKVLRRAGSDAVKYFPVRLVPALTSLVTVPVFTRLIGAEDYGYFYLMNATTSLATSIAAGWIGSSVIRYYWIARREDRRDAYMSTVLWLAVGTLLAAAAVMGIGFWVLRDTLDPGLLRLVPVGIASFVVAGLYTTLLQVIRAANRASAYAILSISMTLVTTALALWFVWAEDMGSLGILAGSLVGHAVLLPFIARDVAKEGSLAPGHVERDFATDFFTYGFPLTIAGLSGWVLVLADRYIIGLLQDAVQVGLYSVAYGLGDKLMQLVSAPLIMTMTPSLVETFETDGQRLAQRAQTQFTRYYAIATFPLIAGMAVAGEDFMHVFTGPEYRSAWFVLPFVAAGVMCNGLAQLAGNGLGLHKRTRIIMTNAVVAAAFSVGMNFLTVGRFGYAAAAINTLASYVLLLALTWWRSRPYMAWEIPWRDLARVVAACVLMAAALAVLFAGVSDSPWLFLAEVAVGMAVYTVALIALGGVRPEERGWVIDGIKRLVPGRPDDADGPDE
jgi:O-antigen/teichoic acid export membrane protein